MCQRRPLSFPSSRFLPIAAMMFIIGTLLYKVRPYIRTDLPKTFIGLKYKNKDKLREAIIKRVEERLKNGAIGEVKNILKMGYKETDPGMKTIGYQQIIKYLNKELTKGKAIDNWVNKEVKYAKRQLTFMKKDKNISWREI